MSFSLSWLSLTNVTEAASVELLLIYIGLPSETHPVNCLGCSQATSGKVSLAGGKLKMVLWIVPFLNAGPSCLCPLRADKPQGALHFCTDSPLPTQPSGSRSKAAQEAELTFLQLSPVWDTEGKHWKSLIIGESSPPAIQIASFMDVSHSTACCRLEGADYICAL